MPVYVDGELVLYGFVGENYWDEGFTAREVLEALAEHGRSNDLTVRINSGGGYLDDGIAIYNALVAHKGRVTVEIDAMAASSASVIAMAGEEIIMREGALMMIHEPSTAGWGTASDMESTAGVLRKQGRLMAEIYAERSGQTLDAVLAAMASTTWMTGPEAVATGYATSTGTAVSGRVSAFDYRTYAAAPERLAALAAEHGWCREKLTAASAAKRQKEPKMTDKTTADGKPADMPDVAALQTQAANDAQARIKAILDCDEAKDRGDVARHLAFNTAMSVDEVKALLSVTPATAKQPETDPQSYDRQRSSARGQALPDGGERQTAKTISASAIYAARAKAMKGA
jgi:ATP-dependent Clp protease protease subunit